MSDDFPGFVNYPDQARLGLIDMAFNFGNLGLVTKFPALTAAARNEEMKKLFEVAVEPI